MKKILIDLKREPYIPAQYFLEDARFSDLELKRNSLDHQEWNEVFKDLN